MNTEQKRTWGWICMVVGILVLIGTARESGKQEERSTNFDRQINRWIDRENRWQPGTTDEQYQPGTTWRYGRGPSTGVIWGGIIGVGLVVAGVAMLATAGKEPLAVDPTQQDE